MSENLKMFHLSLVELYQDFDNESSRQLVKHNYNKLSDDEKEVLDLVCNCEVTDLIY